MKRSNYEEAIRKEVEHWQGVTVEFGEGGKHPKAKFTFDPGNGEPPLKLSRPFAGTPSDAAFGIHAMLGDMRRAMKQLGATRAKPEPSKDEDEAPYRKPIGNPTTPADLVERDPGPVKEDMGEKMVKAGSATPEQAQAARESVQASGSVETYQKAALVGALADELEGMTDEEAEAAVAALRAEIDAIVDGVYFGLPDVVYHAVPRLSASGLQKLCISAGTFWKGSWLDPDRPELDEEQTKAQLLGKAYHCARLEPDRFHATYVRKISKADFPARGLLTSDAAVKAALKDAGEQQTVTGESTEERCERLIDAGYQGTILPLELARWERTVKGRIPIEAKHFDQIATDMERIRGSGEIAQKLTGGAAEVSVFWTDQHGIKMKARFDYLTPAWWDEFKTFDNSRGKTLAQALSDAVRYNRYYVQAGTYRDASEAVRTGGLQIIGEATDDQRALIAAIQIMSDPLDCWFIFQEKGGIPNLLARRFHFDYPVTFGDVETPEMGEAAGREGVRRNTQLYAKALWEIDEAKRLFVLYAEVYEPGTPWFPIEPSGSFDDSDFNQHWLEARY